MFEYDLSDECRKILEKIRKKNPVLAIAIHKKIREIIMRDKNTIHAYKNLRYDLKEYKRVHITDTVILIFKVEIEQNFILFSTIKHRDFAYKS